ncbi:hypothetical protein [Leucobacter sp. OH1287]|uniref:hypothetical protein n=1 Tax=Leucobacter sp. OH1287 TaxID=2491049 RepID=UPI000F5E2315|nr:hypothetical protein [Leucobacter sp. OH1287]RRD61547.1 hypothetical protein EII30_01580 [Leucobacter sp. OH1287]
MTSQPTRKITREFAVIVLAMLLVSLFAFMLFGWGLLFWFTDQWPVPESHPYWQGPLLVIIALIGTAILLWRGVISLLRGNFAPPLGRALVVFLLWYLTWCVGGTIMSFGLANTWFGWHALIAAAVMATGPILSWYFLLRQIYGRNVRPRWLWEKQAEREREIDTLNRLWEQS